MQNRKIQTSFRLTEEEDKRYKDLAIKKGITFNQFVRDCMSSAYSNPDYLNPTTQPTEGDKILKRFLKAQEKEVEVHITSNQDIISRLERLESKMDSLMDKFKVESPIKDESGRRIFE